ncbi:type II toxin-antitoxin system RelE/ParE family toxin [Salmonella enterica subsp. enterica]|jgi:mRNA interferase RelE/StbE|uniref:Type II toxin-antitoxin system RelE/ParE family toxin n=1 Tax=Paenibacillus timonensis TaxID=225915 RepID=A0ABW3SKX0_9BACL|nr:type II toxin-antitoxin system RelE/ParE family toxin [Salmonella enterica subsp. enterica serovar Typhi]ECH9276530.1 type II toxin-antitoxin system RelE/ParE family toxin [Salmonella enterica subsp. enterica]EDW4537599.1 type II toxin-antitoxin system RelE/ParE family toxin [Salmonella enterica subsp. enterica]
MNYSIEFYKEALKYLQRLDKPSRIRIVQHLEILSENPFHPELDIKRMRGTSEEYRLRVGSFRIIYTIEDKQLIIHVLKIGSRGDVYK